MCMKVIYRIPAKEPYGYIEIEDDVDEGFFDPEKMKAQYDVFKETFNSKEEGGEGLPPKEWNAWLDTYLTTSTGNADLYAQMSPAQQAVIQEVKKSLKRLKSKVEPEVDADN